VRALASRGYRIVSGGTDNHLFLVDLIDKTSPARMRTRGSGAANITVNKNASRTIRGPPW